MKKKSRGYPRLDGYIKQRGIKRTVIAKAIECSTRSLQNKINGVYDFSYSESVEIHDRFFPDIPMSELFSGNS